MNNSFFIYKQNVKSASIQAGIPVSIFAGLIEQESNWNPWAFRFEPGYRWLVGDDPHEKLIKPKGETKLTEIEGQKISWGLGQIMGGVARERGFKGWFTELCQPDIGLKFAASHFKYCLKRAKGNIPKALLRYNGGGNPHYPKEVITKAQKYKRIIYENMAQT